MSEAKKKAGQIIAEHIEKNPEQYDVRETGPAMQSDTWAAIEAKVEEGKRIYPKDFFVVLLFKYETVLHRVQRTYILHRWTCPTPNYDQTVFKYHKEHDALEFLWTIPNRETAFAFKNNPLGIYDSQEKELMKFVFDFADGTLYKKAKKLNGERIDSLLLEK